MQTFIDDYVSNEKVNILNCITTKTNIQKKNLKIKSAMFLINLENIKENLNFGNFLKTTEIIIDGNNMVLHRSPILLEILRTNSFFIKENKYLIFKLSMNQGQEIIPYSIYNENIFLKLSSQLNFSGSFIINYAVIDSINNYYNLTTQILPFEGKHNFYQGCQTNFTKKIYYFGNNPNEDLKYTILKFNKKNLLGIDYYESEELFHCEGFKPIDQVNYKDFKPMVTTLDLIKLPNDKLFGFYFENYSIFGIIGGMYSFTNKYLI